VRLPSTLIFDHPTPASAAQFLLTQAGGEPTPATASLEADLRRLEATLTSMADDHRITEIEPRLRIFSSRLSSVLSRDNGRRDSPDHDLAGDLRNVSDEEIFQLIDKEIGSA